MASPPGCRACLRAAPRQAAYVLVVALLLFGLPPPAFPQQITYEYDALGRLILMRSPEGIAQWEYDAVGNILRIASRRYADVSGPVAILGMNPTKGVPGTAVTVYGRGFATTPSENRVTFNGTAATVTTASAGTLTLTVPPGATTGPISVTAPLGSAASPDPFTVLTFVVVPNHASVALGGSVAFDAVQDGTTLVGVTWRVNGLVGGDSAVGTITSTGRYTAPTLLPTTQPLAIEAVHPTEAGAIASAAVQVVGQVSGYEAATPVTIGPTPRPPVVTAAPITVGRVTNSTPAAAAPVSVSRAPLVLGITPANVLPGATVPLSVSGRNLQGATTIRFIRDGALDTGLTVVSVVPVPDGNGLTCTLTVGGSALQGNRILQVVAPHGTSTDVDLGTNRLTVAAP